jgi:SAM-dependent methyltransferase
MNLLDIIHRNPNPTAWSEGGKIPWDEPGFSRRMLREHLTQEHDHASRRQSVIDEHVRWIHAQILGGEPARILDLGCGPGLYSTRLAKLGHDCVGFDFSPASIEYAQQTAVQQSLSCQFNLADIRTADYGSGYDLAMLIYGEFNAFQPAEAKAILRKAYEALNPGGRLLLEVHHLGVVQRVGAEGSSWYSSEGGLFSDEPHLCLIENFWDQDKLVATTRFYVINTFTAQAQPYINTLQGYRPQEYRTMLADAGFGEVEEFPSLGYSDDTTQEDFVVLVALRIVE